jgi:large subunit ribosomal protein L10
MQKSSPGEVAAPRAPWTRLTAGLVVFEGNDMERTEKEQVVAALVEQLRSTESLIVADYRGLTNADLVELRAKVRSSGGRFQVVKNTLTRRAAEEAGTESLLALLEGPTAIAFVEAEGDPVAVAKALADTAKDTNVLTLRGGILSGRSLTGDDVEELAKLPAPEIVKSQLVGVIVAPLTQLVALLDAPVRDLVGLLDARIEQLGGASAEAEPTAEPEPEPEPTAEAETADEPVAEAADGPEAETEAAEPAETGPAETPETEEE